MNSIFALSILGELVVPKMTFFQLGTKCKVFENHLILRSQMSALRSLPEFFARIAMQMLALVKFRKRLSANRFVMSSFTPARMRGSTLFWTKTNMFLFAEKTRWFAPLFSRLWIAQNNSVKWWVSTWYLLRKKSKERSVTMGIQSNLKHLGKLWGQGLNVKKSTKKTTKIRWNS